MLILAKIGLSAIMVIAITLIAEKLSTRFAGVLLGFPLGAGLTFFFTGIEQGSLFAAQSAPWAIQGLSATLVYYTFPWLGVFYGIAISYFVAFLYLLFYEFVLRCPLDRLLAGIRR